MVTKVDINNGYLERVDRLLNHKGSYEINPCDVISIDEAKRFFVTFNSGLTNIAEKAELHAQIAQPKVLTQRMLSILMDGYTTKDQAKIYISAIENEQVSYSCDRSLTIKL